MITDRHPAGVVPDLKGGNFSQIRRVEHLIIVARILVISLQKECGFRLVAWVFFPLVILTPLAQVSKL